MMTLGNESKRRRHLILLLILAATVTSLALVMVFALGTGTVASSPQADCSSPNVGSFIESSTVLSGTLFADGDVTIRNGGSLTLTAGTEFTFCGEFDLRVADGTLHAVGTVDSPIIFDSNDPNANWGAIHYVSPGTTVLTSTLQYVVLNNGGGSNSNADWGAIYVQAGHSTGTSGYNPVMDHVTINDSGSYGLFVHMASSDPTPPPISNLTIDGSVNAPILMYASSVSGLRDGNSFSNNGQDSIEVRVGTVLGGRIFHSQTWRKQPIPYELIGTAANAGLSVGNNPDQPILTLQPGVTLWMGEGTWIKVNSGGLVAEGTEQEPITISRIGNNGPLWKNIFFEANVHPASRVAHTNISYANSDTGSVDIRDGALSLDQVTVSNNTNGAGIYSRAPLVEIKNSTIQFNKVGVQFDLGADGLLRNNLIQGNIEAGLLVTNNNKNTCIDAIGNDWGNAGGPTDSSVALDACNQAKINSGGGDAISDGVLYDPWLAGAGLTDHSRISPDPYWVVANGVDQAKLTVTVRDAGGNPLSGKSIELETTRGTIHQPVGLTDEDGVVTATIQSTQPGDAIITARNVSDDQPLAGIAAVNFWNGYGDSGGLTDPSGVPYVSPELIVEGLPIQIGFPITLSVPMVNGNPEPVDVQVIYSISNLNIGAKFTTVNEVSKVLQPGESWDAAAGWLPNVTGHHCTRAEISVNSLPSLAEFTNINVARTLLWNWKLWDSTWEFIENCPGPAGIGFVDMITGDLGDLFITGMPMFPAGCRSFPHDPPVHEFTQIAVVPQYTPTTVQPIDGVTVAQADALNAMSDALYQSFALSEAITASNDRLSGAAIAGDEYWSARHHQAIGEFYHQYGLTLVNLADALTSLLSATEGADLPDSNVTIQGQIDILDEVRANGFDQLTIDRYHAAGLNDDQIKLLEKTFLTMIPESQLKMTTVYEILRETRDRVQDSADEVLGSTATTLQPAWTTINTSTIQVGQMRNEFIVGNPTDALATVELHVRPVDVPIRWSYHLDNPAPELDPGETVTVTLTIDPGGPVLEETDMRIAVEGFIGDELVGGILFNPTIPSSTPGSRLFLPAINR